MGSVFQHPLSSSSIGNLIHMVRRHGVERRFVPRLAGVGLLSLVRQPVIWLEALRFGRRIREQEIEADPVFIIGHWRSGTTHLQNVLSRDEQFAGVTLGQAAMPLDFLTLGGLLNGPMAKSLPRKRLMDNVAVAADCPWEEELALACTSPLSFYHVSFFPNGVGQVFRNAILFDGNKKQLIERWKADYLTFLKKVQWTQAGKRFLLKNPANSARIKILMEMFPGARFIHIHRNPYKVFASTLHLYLKAQAEWGFNQIRRSDLVEHILETYPLLMHAYFDQRKALSKNQLVEVAFQDLQKAPMETLEDIYIQLGLDGFEEAAPAFNDYLLSVGDYQKNKLELSEADKAIVAQRWKGVFDELGYEI